VLWDTCRADATEPYGAPAGTTPVLADLARRGVAVESVRAPSCWTLPSHAGLFSGRMPRALGLVPGGPGPSAALGAHRGLLLAEVLRRRGWSTAAASANPFVAPWGGFDIGFDTFESVPGRAGRPGREWRARLAWDLEAVRARLDHGVATIDRIVDGWIHDARNGPRSQPFFWFCNLMECHSPYLPPRPWSDLGLVDRWRAGVEARRYSTQQARAAYSSGQLEIPGPAIDRMRHLYGRAVRSLDAALGRLLERLDRARLLDDTLVVVTADHGENLGDGHRLGHQGSLDDRLLRVPLVMAGATPGPLPPPGDGTAPVGLTQLPSLLANALDLAGDPWRSGLSAVEGTLVAETDGLAIFGSESLTALAAEWGLSAADVDALTGSLTCATDGRFKLLRSAAHGPDRLYDLAADPLETVDIAPDRPEVVARLAAALPPPDPAARPAEAGEGSRRGESQELEALADRLRLLGYLPDEPRE
jgi:arylsulfatase A-like enzyme